MIDFDATVNAAVLDAFAKSGGINYHPVGGDLFAIRGELRRDPVDVVGEGDAISASRQNTLSIRLSECPVGFSVNIDTDRVEIDGVFWRVVDQDDNGEGFVTLLLHKED